MTDSAKPNETAEAIAGGRFLRLVHRGGWEFVERTNTTGVVTIVAVTDDGSLVLTEQFRPPVGRPVIELPAGLAGDVPGEEHEELAEAAKRELLEETGFEAAQWRYLSEGPPSAGMSSEIVTFFRAERLRRIDAGGGDDSEEIVVHVVPLSDVGDWLRRQESAGKLVDPKVFTGLYFAGHRFES